MLGKFVFSSLQGVDIRDNRWIASVQLKLDDIGKKVPFERVLYGIGIRHIGETTAKKLAYYFKSIDALKNATLEQLLDVGDIG